MTIIKKIYNLRHDSLFRNSIYLMLATAVMAGFGFFFWLITAKIFITKDIGIATTLISVMSLIGTFSLVGFGSTFIRFLPNSERPNDKLNTGLIIVGITALILSSFFLIFVNNISPNLGFITDSPLIALSFIFFCIMTALNVLTDSVFLAGRQAKYTLIINTTFSGIKMILPFAFVGWGALGIFMAAALAQTVGFFLSIGVMMWKFNYKPEIVIKLDIIKQVWRFSAASYLAGVLFMLPTSYLPVLITNSLGAESSAYFYISMMIGNLLYIIPKATTGSLFAEGSNDIRSLNTNIIKTIKINSYLLIPSVTIVLIFGGFILNIFGKNYGNGGAIFLRLIAVASFSVGAYSLLATIFSIRKNLKSIIIINAFYAILTIILSYIFLPYGLIGIGLAWLFGNTIAVVAGIILYNYSN